MLGIQKGVGYMSEKVKLYEVPRGSRIIVDGVVLNFHHIDGMYSYCKDPEGKIVHFAAWTKVKKVCP